MNGMIRCVGWRRLALLTLLLALALPPWLLAAVRPAAAADYTVSVNTTADTNNACAATGTGTCSLRDAVRFANLAHSADPNVVTRILLPYGTCTLSQAGRGEDFAVTGDLDIRAKVEIVGMWPDVTAISGGGIDRVFDVQAGYRLDLYFLTVRDGNPGVNAFGGGIRNAGTLNLGYTVVYNSLTTGSGKGGGIASSGALGGDRVAVVATTTATQGGGIYISAGTLALTNSTIASNGSTVTGGGLSLGDGSATLLHVTVAGNTNGGVERVAGTLTLYNSIVADNTAWNCAGAITNGGYNLDSGATCGFGAAAGSLSNANARLDPLTGPIPYRPIRADSDARDRIPATGANCASVDQRGASRPQGPTCDIGAFEYVATATLTIETEGTGSVGRSPAGTGSGPFGYPPGTVVTLQPNPGMGWVFVGWRVDGVYRGWASPLTLTMDIDHTVRAVFAPIVGFSDVGASRPDYGAIGALAARGTILGYGGGRFGPDDTVQRAQMAALIARAMPSDPGTWTLTPPACTVAGSWDCESWPNTFTDRNGLDGNLWRDVAALQHYRVAFGYDGAACAARGVASPCYAPTAQVSYVETVVFITRAMIAKGYWVAQPGAPQPYAGVPAIFTPEVAIYHFYTGARGGIPASPGNWNAGATRGWFARALWQALNSYWGTDGVLPDGRPAGGYAP